MTGKTFVDAFLAESLRPYAHLARWDRPIGTWLVLFPGWWTLALASGGVRGDLLQWETLQLFLIFAAGAFLVRGAGCTVNDIWDRDIDGGVERTQTRPLAAGTVTLKQALGFAGLQFLLGLLLLLQLNHFTIMIGVASVLPICLYPLLKRVTWWPQLGLGLVFNISALMGWAAVTGTLAWTAIFIYIGCICWTIGYDTIYAHQDREDDARLGLKSTARLFGKHSKPLVGLFYVLAWLFWTAASLIIFTHGWLMLLPGLHLLWQLVVWRTDDPESCLKIFRSNRTLGWIVFILFLL
jgi:4-hydroxybenzoate polyprenyltransferase